MQHQHRHTEASFMGKIRCIKMQVRGINVKTGDEETYTMERTK